MPYAVGEVIAVAHASGTLEFAKVIRFDGVDYILRCLDHVDEDGDRGHWLCAQKSKHYRLSRAICTFVGPVKCP